MIEALAFEPALSRPELLAEPVRLCLEQHREAAWFGEVMVAGIDVRFAGGAKLCEHYGLDMRQAGIAWCWRRAKALHPRWRCA